MRKLETGDVFSFSRCIKAIGAKDLLKAAAKDADSIKDVWGHGFDLVWDIFDLATENNGEQHIYTFLSGPFEMTTEQVAKIPLTELAKMLKQLAEENDLPAFFKFAGKLMK